MTPTTTDIDDLVSLERGEVDRRIYSDPAIFEREMEQIFGRAWLFLCHESQIPEPGDFFASVMGRDNVLVVRQKDGSIRAMLNTCAHRGNAVCRAEEGNAKGFLCTYHGWSYGIDGRLVGVPGYRNFYDGEVDKNRLGLTPVAQLASYPASAGATVECLIDNNSFVNLPFTGTILQPHFSTLSAGGHHFRIRQVTGSFFFLSLTVYRF